MANSNPFLFGNFPGGDSEAWMRQFWNVWGNAMRSAGGAGAPNPFGMPGFSPSGLPDWQQTLDWWSRSLHGTRGNANDAIERLSAQARHWFGQMQDVAAQFAGRDAAAADIVAGWKQALGAAGDNLFPEIFRAMRGRGMHDLERWMEDAAPYLHAWQQQMRGWLSLPTFGLSREHQERLQQLAQAQLDYQQHSGAFNAVLAKAGQRAFELFETKLAEREEPGKAIASGRALFDLWIEAAEEAYAQVALSPEFRHAFGALTNAQMRLRSEIQGQVESACELFGMPTRTEIDSAHRKIAELERTLRRMARTESGSAQSDRTQAPQERTAAAAAQIAAESPESKSTKPQPAGAKPTTSKKTAAEKPAAQKPSVQTLPAPLAKSKRVN